MKLTIFGADDDLGRYLALHASWLNHEVTVYSRKMADLNLPEGSSIKTLEGYVFDQRGVAKAIKGADAVISILEASTDPLDKTLTLGTKRILEGLAKHKVSRFVALGDGLLLDDAEGLMYGEDDDRSDGDKNKFAQLHKMYAALAETEGVNWTLVCPFHVLTKELEGFVWTNADAPVTGTQDTVGSGDLIDFMVKAATRNEGLAPRRLAIKSVSEQTYKALKDAEEE